MIKSIINKFLTKDWQIFTGFFLLSFFIYLPGIDGRFTSDFYNWTNVYETSSLKELWTCFGYPGLHQMYHIPFYLCYKIFGLSKLPWHIVFIGLHSFNAFLLFVASRKLFEVIELGKQWALLASTLFLLSPFQTETVAWGATIHYLLMVTFLLSSFNQFLDFLKNREKSSLIRLYIFYLFGLFTMELPLVFPAVFVIYALVTIQYYNLSLKEIIVKLTLPFIAIFIGYFILSKMVFGAFIGHYGAEKHLTFDLYAMLNVLNAYFMKFIFFFRYIPISTVKEFLMKLFTNGIFQVATLIPIVTLVIWSIIKPSIKISKAIFIFAFAIFFGITLLPVLNIEMSSNIFMQTDRYSYLASIFFFLLFTVLISMMRTGIRTIFILFYIILNTSLLMKDVLIWRETGILAKRMIDSYKFENDITYTLNLPDNHKGAYLFRNGFEAAMNLEKGIDITGKFNHLLSINTTTLEDSISYAVKGDTIHIEAMKWGRWFWRNGRGATNFEDENFKFINGYMGAECDLIVKQPTDKTFIYLSGGNWKKVDFK